MNNILEDPRPIQDGGSFDVIVVGGGISGISASVASARAGANVLLLEKNILLGGLATVGLISWYEPLCDGEGRKMTSGIAEELIRLAVRYGPNNLAEIWQADEKLSEKRCAGASRGQKSDRDRREHRRYASFFSPTIFALALNEYIEKNNVKLLLDVLAAYPVMEGNTCRGVVVQAKEGRIFFAGKVVVDTTGDASVLHAGKVPTIDGKNFLSYVSHVTTSEELKELANGEDLLGLRRWQWEGYTLANGGHPEKVPLYAGVTSSEITDYVRIGQRMLFEKVKMEPVGSFDILTLPAMAQMRTCRRLDGAYTFRGDDERKFEDAIGACGDFRVRGPKWQIPYRALYHPDFPNLLAAGRIISAEGEGWEVTRVIPVCALTGQAAGTAAAIAVAEKCGVQQVDIRRLQMLLSQDGVTLDWE